MDKNSISKGIVGSLDLLKGIVIGISSLFIVSTIYVLISGSITNTVTSGSIPVSTTTNTTLAGFDTDINTEVNAALDNVTLVVSLVAIAVIFALFSWFLGGSKSRGKSY